MCHDSQETGSTEGADSGTKHQELHKTHRECRNMTEETAQFKENQKEEKKQFVKFFGSYELTNQEIDPYGDCQFLSVGQEVILLRRLKSRELFRISDEERNELADALRADAVRYMRDNSELFAPFVAPQEGPWNLLDGGADNNFNAF